ncbi:hypothetical protein [Streptomyces zingiberis]|uniref:LPXTG cell wall anchor domain-containing protein n=1 Tax=Streptomyces zingiberis TaxID=2053010 RepID=A0ABX1BU34_9ACTN|nr:hypothetical protein [Streptomyces zingiberis]NJQ00593.1 hypothetical protein [Streptomyces zingiberis]
MSARRPLLTASTAGAMLLALWFVPSANATVEEGRAPSAEQAGQTGQTGLETQQERGAALPSESVPGEDQPVTDAEELALADTGSVDTTPYLLGGTLFLGLGAALVSASARRSRALAAPLTAP